MVMKNPSEASSVRLVPLPARPDGCAHTVTHSAGKPGLANFISGGHFPINGVAVIQKKTEKPTP